MATVRYADRYQCDSCGAEADGRPVDLARPGQPDTLPDDWTATLTAPTSMSAIRAVQVCGACSVLPFAEVLARLAP